MQELVFNWPQIVYLILLAIGFISALTKGDGAYSIIFSVLAFVILFLLYQGGFFHQAPNT